MVSRETDRVPDCGQIAVQIAARLSHSYGWVDRDDLRGYAQLGVALAARRYRGDRGVSLEVFAYHKGMFLAIDEMRRDGVLRRRDAKAAPPACALRDDLPDPAGQRSHDRLVQRDLLASLLGRLAPAERRLLLMHYAQHMTFREIAAVFQISESAVSLRHKALLGRLRRAANRQTV